MSLEWTPPSPRLKLLAPRPPGRAVAISGDDPDLLVYAARNLLYVSRNGGVFWTALALELPEIERIAI